MKKVLIIVLVFFLLGLACNYSPGRSEAEIESTVISKITQTANKSMAATITKNAIPIQVTTTAPSSQKGWLCFEYSNDIWIIREDGSGRKNLTNTVDIWENDPKWSRDGSKIVFTDINDNIFIINSDGSGFKKIGTGKFPSWSPDGNQILYLNHSSTKGTTVTQMNLLNIGSGKIDLVYQLSPSAILSLIFSPDGKWIYFSTGDINRVRPDGSEMTKVIEKREGYFASLSFSRDGQKLAFTSLIPITRGSKSWVEYSDIYIAQADGTQLKNITNNGPDSTYELKPGKNVLKIDTNPSWTSDDRIVYISNYGLGEYKFRPFIMNKGGSESKLLVDHEVNNIDYTPTVNLLNLAGPNQVSPTTTLVPTKRATENKVFNFVFDPPSPSNFKLENGIKFTFEYSSIEKDPVLIFFDPLINGMGQHNISTYGSPYYQPGYGKGDNRFFKNSNLIDASLGHNITGFTCTMMKLDKKTILFSIKVPVDFKAR